jgi:nitrile hydratase
MNGGQDLGGMMGFGPVVPDPEHVRFHADWEKRVLAMNLASGALRRWSIDASRHARETLHPAEYLSSSYYQIWLKGLEKLLLADGLVSAAELAAGHAIDPALPMPPALQADQVAGVLARGTNYLRPETAPARFAVGQAVRTRNIHPTGHTRLPRYARGKVGVVDRVHGVFVLPDARAHGPEEDPQWLYTVRFTGPELWGEGADPTLEVSIDAWEGYLDPA